MSKSTTALTIPSQLDRAHTALARASTDFERLTIRDQARAYQAAAEILNRRDIQVQASVLVQRAERAISKANPPLPDGRPGHSVPLEDAMSRSTLRNMRAVHSKLTDAQFEARTVQAIETETPLTRESLKAQQRPPFELKTGDYEWNTPPEIIEAARDCMGGIDLDPASNVTAQQIVQAERYYTVQDDGLAQPWNGRVWMNPPYRGGAINRFIEKLIASPGVQQAVVITGPYHDTKYGQSLAGASNCLCLVAGRIKFLKGANEREAPPFASVIHGVRVDAGRFQSAFSGMGGVWVRPTEH